MWEKALTKLCQAIAISIAVVTFLGAPVVWAAGTTDSKAQYDPCSHLPSDGKDKCQQCMGTSGSGSGSSDAKGFWTAMGCVPTDPLGAARDLLDFMLGIGGFFVVVQILIGSFKLLTSRGNSQALQEARERITNSIIALLFIVFSVTIIEFVGVRILHLPGFFDGTDSTSGDLPTDK